MLITAGEEHHHFKRGEKEKVRGKRFSLRLEGCEDSVFPIAPEITHSIQTSEPEVAR